jgi:hypothetical protein
VGVAGWIALSNGSLPIALVSLVFAVGSALWGRQRAQTLQRKQKVIEQLLDTKAQVKDELNREREEKKLKNKRLSNLKRVLKRKGIDTEYLLDKYDNSLYAPLMVLTHFSAPRNNPKDKAEVIDSNLEELDSKMLHGSARIIPPRNFDQSRSSKQELQEWFDANVLDNRDDIAHKLEVISRVDVTKTFDRDASVDDDGPDFKTNTISDLFETDTVLPTEDLLKILSRSDRISPEEELQENIGLLAVPHASETQMEQIIGAQVELEDSLGETTQIAQTTVEDIKAELDEHDIEDPEELAENLKGEAHRIQELLK